MWAAYNGHTACVQALVAAKAALDIKTVSYARLFACPVTLESPSIFKPNKAPLKLVLCVLACVCVRACLRTHFFCYCLAFLRLISLSSLFRLFLPPVRLFLPSHTFTPYSEFALRSIAVPQQSNCPSLLVCPPIELAFQRFVSQSYIWLFCVTPFLVSHFHPWCDMTSRVY